MTHVSEYLMDPTCSIMDNTATIAGGGVFADNTGKVLSNDFEAIIMRNSAPQGGGVYLINCPAFTVSGTFLDNTATQEGASLYVVDTPLLKLSQVKFVTGGGPVSSVALYNSSKNMEWWSDVSFEGSEDAFIAMTVKVVIIFVCVWACVCECVSVCVCVRVCGVCVDVRGVCVGVRVKECFFNFI